MILMDHIEWLAEVASDRPALLACSKDGTIVGILKYKELFSKITETSKRLSGLDLHAGDRVAIGFGNSTDFLVVSWAAWCMGIITVPLDTKRDTDELRMYKIRASNVKHTLTTGSLLKATSGPIVVMNDDDYSALILFTSGTTAYPKGAILTLKSLLVNADCVRKWMKITESDRFLVQLPLHHINSTTFCLAALLAGASIAIPPKYSNSRFWAQAANSGATLTSVVPSIIFDQLARIEEFDAIKARVKLNRIQLGSAPVVTSDALAFIDWFRIPLYQGYGQTETALRVTGVPMDLPKEVYDNAVLENSIGVPMSWAEVQTSDNSGHILGENEEGELIVRGAALMQGYVGGETAFRDGYFLTGDIGYWKKIGDYRFFYLKGRTKEIIIKGGVNISPVAVEDALKRLDADIEQVYVIGIGDERYGEEVGAVVVWRTGIDTASALRHLKLVLLTGSEMLSGYETPKYLTVVTTSELPTTSTGKVQRVVLKKNVSMKMESLYDLAKSHDFNFTIISSQSSLASASFDIYNHCWQPLTVTKAEYAKYLDTNLTLGAVDAGGILQGQISFSYADNKITCVSICSAAYKPKTIPKITANATPEEVREYLLAGHDPVMNFHTKMGATLVKVIPQGRPKDVSSLGYTMLLAYPEFDHNAITGDASVSNRLVEAVRLLGKDVGADVFALSRPGGLAAHLSRA